MTLANLVGMNYPAGTPTTTIAPEFLFTLFVHFLFTPQRR